jgi:hypothetical protein
MAAPSRRWSWPPDGHDRAEGTAVVVVDAEEEPPGSQVGGGEIAADRERRPVVPDPADEAVVVLALEHVELLEVEALGHAVGAGGAGRVVERSSRWPPQ